MDRISRNLDEILQRIAQAARRAGRKPEEITLVAVTKSVGVGEIETLRGLGVRHFGENRVDLARPKIETVGRSDVVWHMIGSVQRRKARDVAELFDTVDSLDRIELLLELQKRCEEQGKTLQTLVEVNVSGEASKHGFAPKELEAALEVLGRCSALRVRGLMTMAPLEGGLDAARRTFAGLRELAERFGLPERSMGMSDDFEVAIEEGATQVRIGSALFNEC